MLDFSSEALFGLGLLLAMIIVSFPFNFLVLLLFRRIDKKFTYINEIFKGYLEATSNQDKQRRLKKRLDKSSQELCDYVDKYIERKESEGEKDVTTTDLL